MPWFVIPIICALLWSFCDFIDNFLVDHYAKRLNPKASQGLFIVTGGIVVLGLGLYLGSAIWTAGNLWLPLLAGAINTFGTVFYWFSLRRSDTTDVTLLMQLSPLLSLCFATLFLGQSISLPQFAGFLLILLAAIVVVLASGAKKLKFNLKTAGQIAAACTIWVVSDVIFVASAGGSEGVLPNFFWLLVGGIIMNLGLFAVKKSWRRDLRTYLKRGQLGGKIFWTSLDEALWTIAEFLWRYGMIIAPLAILSVMEGVSRLLITFVLGIVLTLIAPRFGREKLTKKVLAHHAIATVLMVIAIVIIS